MYHTQQDMVNAHHKGNILKFHEVGLMFENTENFRFTISRRSSFQHLKERIEMKLQSGSVS